MAIKQCKIINSARGSIYMVKSANFALQTYFKYWMNKCESVWLTVVLRCDIS